MVLTNPFKEKIESLNNVREMGECAATAHQIYLEHMKIDPAHDDEHILRVVRHALWFGEGGDPDVIIPAALLHDLINLPKDHPTRHRASRLSAIKATTLMKQAGVLKDDLYWSNLYNAIEAHSWSAQVDPTTLEAKAVQDADRIDALGFVGIARLFSVGGSMGRTLVHPTDPRARYRYLEEYTYTLDHYFVKLRNIPMSMKTERGQIEADRLFKKMEAFVEGMIDEL